jgi:hypothetical protein
MLHGRVRFCSTRFTAPSTREDMSPRPLTHIAIRDIPELDPVGGRSKLELQVVARPGERMRQQRSWRKSEENIRRKWTVAIHKPADKAEKNKKRSRDPKKCIYRMSRILHAADHSVTSRMGICASLLIWSLTHRKAQTPIQPKHGNCYSEVGFGLGNSACDVSTH